MKWLILLLVFMFIGCTDSNVVKSRDKLYSIDNGAFYLRKITIGGAKIFIVTDKDGYPIAGASAHYNKNNSKESVSSIVE